MEYQRAQESARRGGRYAGAVAAFYAQRAHAFTERARSADMSAADRLVQEQRPLGRRYWVDLHGVYVKEAMVIVERELSQWERKEWRPCVDQQRPATPLTIVTGVGRRSNGMGKLLPAVERHLHQNGWRFEQSEEGVFVVLGKQRW